MVEESAAFSQTTVNKKARTFQYRLFRLAFAKNMAGVERFELPTRGFGIRCSASWSYTPVVILMT